MKLYFCIALSILNATTTLADTDASFTILQRQEGSSRIYYSKKEMVNLVSPDSFDGKYFKIVRAKSNEAISFDEKDEKILLRAATVYYHLNLARDFWVHQIKSDAAEKLSKITVRIDISNQFDELGHFANDNKRPQFNNAISIPEGQTPEWVPVEKQDKWNKEIWFRPSKSVLTKDLGPMGPNPLTVSLEALEYPLISYTQNQFNQRLMEEIFYPAYVSRSMEQDLIRYAGTYAIMKIIIYGSRYADRLFIDKYYYLDTAMIPEIAYHEYAHLVLSDHLEMSHSTPVNEGMADYFAAVQSRKRKIYAKVPGLSNAASKDTQEKGKYSHWNESNRQATADFTLSVLWDVRETLGAEVGDKVVYKARHYLKTSTSTISDGLIRAIIKACDVKCESPRRDKYKLYQTFSKKGF